MDPITAGLAIANLVPSLMKFFGAGTTATSVATAVIDTAKKITGKDNTEEAIDDLAKDPALLLQFRQAVLANNLAWEQLYYSDMANARARDAEFLKAGTRNYRADVLVACVVIGIITIAVISNVNEPSEFAKGVLLTILGVLISEFKQITSFEFGSTRASRSKDDTINNLSKEP